MGRKRAGRVVLAGALALGLGAGTVVTALPAAAATTKIKLTDQNKPNDRVYVDNGAPGPSAGDEYIFHSVLICVDNCGTPGARVGTLDVDCTFLARYMQDCQGTARFFGRGKITFGGAIKAYHPSFVLAITGGTGEFSSASGSIYVDTTNATDAGNGEKIVIHLA